MATHTTIWIYRQCGVWELPTDFLRHVFVGDLGVRLLRQDLEEDHCRHEEWSRQLPAVVLAIHPHHQVRVGQQTHWVLTKLRERHVGILEGI